MALILWFMLKRQGSRGGMKAHQMEETPAPKNGHATKKDDKSFLTFSTPQCTSIKGLMVSIKGFLGISQRVVGG